MKIYTSYYGNLRNLEEENIIPICISQTVPKYLKGMAYCDKLAPNRDMHERGYSWDEFRLRVLTPLDQQLIFMELEDLGKGKDIALCCYEKDPLTCHRHLVGEWLSLKSGVPVQEWVKEDPQPLLF
ncbi:DUF488 family protein, N3 subclade [Leptospira sp. GIMC2001]|uniref:DUF488 family protein, N3 subclade n=1 Tax=Leptospira sp. GIMC2001 TaxID=1513297 RepID=UPI00234B6A7E|nr:DUF488 family protein [Leptospira sp. GIMC2001]WCL51439.1 DUF488 family protein [Leptospira sp. GIMC2001]